MAIFSEGMGQLLVKFKELRDKLELSKDRSKQGNYTQLYLPFYKLQYTF